MRQANTLPLACACLAFAEPALLASPAAAQETAQKPTAPAPSAPAPIDPVTGEGSGVEHPSDATHMPRDPASAQPLPSAASKRRDSRLRIEVGTTARYISNYFQAQDEFNSAAAATPKESAYITTLSGSVAYDLIHEPQRTLTAGARVRRNLFSDLDGADSTEFDVTLNYRARPNEVRLGFYRNPRRLTSVVAGRKIYGETNRVNAEYLRRLDRRWRVGAGYEFARETYSEFNQRDLSRHQFRGDVRYQITPWFAPGVGFEYVEANGRSDNFSYKQASPLLLVTSTIKDVAYLSFRYRISDRDYSTDLPTDSNFRREDKRHELSFYGTVQLGHGFSLFGFAYHTDSNSNRASSSFKSDDLGLGLFYRFL